MKFNRTVLVLAFVTQACFAAEQLPTDVKKYIVKRETCDHLRGEIPDPEDKERLEEVIASINRHCKGTDARLLSLRKKYAANEAVISRLSTFEPTIEKRKRE
jgi:hypothetical protein